MKDVKKKMTFRMKPQHIQWIRVCAEIEKRTLISVLEEALEDYFCWPGSIKNEIPNT